ncbi:MAG: glycoside hydrolase family 43 protein [Rikenellaceae bacterium]
MYKKIFLSLVIFTSSFVSVFAHNTEVTIKGDAFYINGRPTYEGRYWNGHKVEGLLMNSRMVQGLFDNRLITDGEKSIYAYTDTGKYDADRNTTEFVAAMEDWYTHGLLGFTLNLQGGSPMGYGGNEKCLNSAFEADGTFRDDYKGRLKLILDRADELGMVVILGYFYQGQDQRLTDEKAIYRAVDEATAWILENGYHNVIVEVANECDVKAYDHEILKPAQTHELISYIKNITRDGRSLLVSTSFKGCSVPTEQVVAVSDFILIHGNGMKKADQMYNCITKTRALSTYTPKPIVVNEDDNYNFDTHYSNITVAVENYASWGYFDYRREGDSMNDGFQSVPVDWTISSDRKKAFFDTVKRITNFGAEPETFDNPILPGYHPDPSICRVGEDYYLINSSFEWYPAIPIYHSKDLVNWELIAYGGTKENNFKLDYDAKDSGGIFAATIHYHDGLFYIITTNTGRQGNFYITAENPAGPWSEPVYIGTTGIDPALFWDEDGRSYYVGQGNITGTEDYQGQKGAWLQEIDLKAGKMIGEAKQLTHGHSSRARAAEGPHLYKIGGKYIIMLAEGGTYRGHAMTTFHSDSLWGPYLASTANPIITHRHLGPQYPISSIGHADIVQTQHGDWWMVALGRRHFNGFVYLSRETFLSPLSVRTENTPYNEVMLVVNEGEGKIPEVAQRPNLPWTPYVKAPIRDNFEGDKLDAEWNFLRVIESEWHTLKDGKLTVELRPESAREFVNPSLIAKRISHHTFTASTRMNFKTKKANEQAGLVLYRSSICYMTFTKSNGELIVTSRIKGEEAEVARVKCDLDELILAMESDGKDVTFKYCAPDKPYVTIENVSVPLAVISDDYIGKYSGPMIGVYATSEGEKSRNTASFEWFDYTDR